MWQRQMQGMPKSSKVGQFFTQILVFRRENSLASSFDTDNFFKKNSCLLYQIVQPPFKLMNEIQRVHITAIVLSQPVSREFKVSIYLIILWHQKVKSILYDQNYKKKFFCLYLFCELLLTVVVIQHPMYTLVFNFICFTLIICKHYIFQRPFKPFMNRLLDYFRILLQTYPQIPKMTKTIHAT